MTADEIKRRLKAFAKSSSGYHDLQRLMMRYGFECFFRRLAASGHKSEFVLKGAMLLAVLGVERQRNTKDADFQVYGKHDANSLKLFFSEICAINQDDGLTLDCDSITVEAVGEEREYPGFQVRVPAALGDSPLVLLFDIGFGEIISPQTRIIEIPTLAGMPKPSLRAYPWEAVIAEKFQALVSLGMRNSRLKDFYDLTEIAQLQQFEEGVLADALVNTFKHRSTDLPSETPLTLTDAFYGNKQKKADWNAFLTRHALPNATRLDECCHQIDQFLMPVVSAILKSEVGDSKWDGNQWHA